LTSPGFPFEIVFRRKAEREIIFNQPFLLGKGFIGLVEYIRFKIVPDDPGD